LPTWGLADLKLTVVDAIPVDVRHNSKVDRRRPLRRSPGLNRLRSLRTGI